MPAPTVSLAAIGDLTAPFAGVTVAELADADLLSGQRAVAEIRRRVDAVAAAFAGEIAHRSRRELGREGLAQANGQRTAEGLISQLTGTSTRDARTLVKAAELLPVAPERIAPAAPPQPGWMRVIGEAVARAALSVEAAEIIRTRLAAAAGPLPGASASAGAGAGGDDAAPPDQLTPEQRERLETALADAAQRLVTEASTLTIEQLAVRAAQARDEIDAAGAVQREEALRQKRYLRFTKLTDGMTRVSGLLDQESAAIVVPILDAATSPRRGGPRFVDPDAAQRAEEIVRDQRTTEQLTLDVFVDLVRIGARVDDGKLLGDRKPAVRILVTQTDLETMPDADGSRPGAAYFEGQTDAVSISTAERYICATGAIPILFDGDGRVLNLGREQRLFSEKQRIALAARDGGCLMCDRPPSWCEAHHIDHWDEHHGRTDIDDGVLLCRFCHLTVHNRGWRIRRHGADYYLEHKDRNGILRRTPLPSHNPTRNRLLLAG